MNAQTFAEGYKAAQMVIAAQLQGISHEESLAQPSKEENCLNWIAGHLLSSRGRILTELGGEGFLTEEESERYKMGSEAIGPGSRCVDLARLTEGLNQTGETLLARIKQTTSEDLSRELDPKQFPIPVEEPTLATLLALFMYHEGYHSGQLALGRRLLGKPSGLEGPEVSNGAPG